MALERIQYGSLASSAQLNHNFEYLADSLETATTNFNARMTEINEADALLRADVQSFLSKELFLLRVGTILPYAGSTLPTGFLLCDGSEIAVADYSDLYAAIGTAFGSSDSTTFCVPDLTDKTLWGVGDNTLGTELESLLPNLYGQFRLSGTGGNCSYNGVFSNNSKAGPNSEGHSSGANNPTMTFDASTYNSIYSADASIVQPPSVVVNFIIKY